MHLPTTMHSPTCHTLPTMHLPTYHALTYIPCTYLQPCTLTCAFLPGLQQSVLTGLCLQGSPYQVQADYLIAADGASSRVRKQLGIDMVGEAAMQHLVNIHFLSKDLWQHVMERPAMLYFVFSSQAIVVLVAHNLQEGEMVAQVSRCSEGKQSKEKKRKEKKREEKRREEKRREEKRREEKRREEKRREEKRR